MTILIFIVISFSFFTQSLLGFGGGLICIPILSLFMPVQDVVSMVIIYQFSLGLLVVKNYQDTNWQYIRNMILSMIVGVFLGVLLLKFLHGDLIRIALASYILLHLARKHTNFDPLGRIIEWGGVHLAGFLGGLINAMIGSGGPAFILYLKDKAKTSAEFRANITAILFLSNIPRIIGMLGAEMISKEIIITGLYAYPGFLLSMILGQKLHHKIPQHKFFIAVEILLAFSVLLLIIKIIL